MTIYAQGIASVAEGADAFILDIWGVLHDGVAPFPGTIRCLENLRRAGKKILLLSNTPDRSDYVAGSLQRKGIRPDLYDHILTAGESAWRSLKERSDDFHRACGMKCFNPGTDFRLDETGVPLFLKGLDLEIVEDPAQAGFILNACGGVDGELEGQWEKTRQALALGLPMICLNPDLVVHIGERLVVCAGTFAKFYEENGGAVVYHGKPHRPVYERAWDMLGRPPKDRMVAVGDSLHTDIRGAANFGIRSVLNLGGIHREEVPDDPYGAAALESFLAGAPARPDVVISGFAWDAESGKGGRAATGFA